MGMAREESLLVFRANQHNAGLGGGMPKATRRKSFGDYEVDGRDWITLATGEYYPDILPDACQLYEPVLTLFGQMLKSSESSIRLLMNIADVPGQ